MTVSFAAVADGAVTWEYGDGSGEEGLSVSHTYLGDPTMEELFVARATVVNENNCVAVDSLSLATLPSPVADFAMNTLSGCSPLTVQFSESSQRADSFEWNYGDNTQASGLGGVSHEHTFLNQGSLQEFHNVTLTVQTANGCSDSLTRIVEVYPEASFELALGQEEVCAPFSFMVPAVAGATNHNWSFGDGTSASLLANPEHTYFNDSDAPITYSLKLDAESVFGCPGSVQRNLIVNPEPVADFSANIQSGCAPLQVTFNDMSLRANQLVWTYGDGDNASGLGGVEHLHTFDADGTDPVTRVVTLEVEGEGGCTHSKSVPVEVHPRVVAQPVGETSGCAPWQSHLVAEGYESVTNHDICLDD